MRRKIAKYLHIPAAIVWLGGASRVILLGSFAARRDKPENAIQITGFIEILGNRIFAPSTVAILLLGIFLVWVEWSFLEAWVVIGLVGILLTGVMGGMVLTPTMVEQVALERLAEVTALGDNLRRSARADLVMRAVIV